MRYKITTPEPGTDGRHAGILFNDGTAFVDTANPDQRRSLSYFKQAGYIVEQVDAQGNVIVIDEQQPVDGETSVDVEDTTGVLPELPPVTALKPEWVEAAVLRGWPRDVAMKTTKPELMDRLTAGEPPPAPEPAESDSTVVPPNSADLAGPADDDDENTSEVPA